MFFIKFFKLLGKKRSLDEIEHEIIRKRFSQFSVFEILSLPKDETTISAIEFNIKLEKVKDRLKIIEKQKKIINQLLK